MSARAKKNLFGTPKALRARQTTPASGGVAQHTGRGAGLTRDKSLTLGNYQGYRIWQDAAGEFRFSGDPDSAFGSFRAVKSHIEWLKKGRGNPAVEGVHFSLGNGGVVIWSDNWERLTEWAGSGKHGFRFRAGGPETYGHTDIVRHQHQNPEPATAVVESEIPVFRSGPAGFPGVEYLVSYPELNQAVAYAQAVKGVYPGVGVVCLEESEKKLPGGDYAVVQDAAAVRAVEAGQVGSVENPRGMWPVPYEVDEGIWYGAVNLALKSRMLSAAQVNKAADRLIDELYGRNAVVDRSQVEHIHTLFTNSYADARQMSTKELRKLAAKRAEHLKRTANPEGSDSADMTVRLKQAATPRGGYTSAWSPWLYFRDVTDAYQYLRELRDKARAHRSKFSVKMERKGSSGAWGSAGKTVTIKANPEGAAAEMYEAFHGRSADRILEITEELHEHEWLAEIGALVSFEIETPTGLGAQLEFTSDAPKLATNEEGTQLFVRGGNQRIDLKPLKMDGSDWAKESMVLGWIWKLTYQTEKSFDKFETVDYYHKLSEEEKGSTEKRRKTLPSLRYDTVNEKLHIDGGKYRIKKPLLGVSPGIEN